MELKLRRQLVMELFCSMSRLRSKNVSSRDVSVSQHRHRVSFVTVPCTKARSLEAVAQEDHNISGATLQLVSML